MSSAPHHHAAENAGVLAGLPGSDRAPGSGPAVADLFASLLEDASGLLALPTDARHHAAGRAEHAVAGHGDLVGARVVAARDVDGVVAAPDAATRRARVVVEADPGAADPLADAAQVATTLDARDDVEVVALVVPVPSPADATAAAHIAGRLALATPREEVRVWVTVAPGRGLPGVLAVLARAGDRVGACLPVGGSTPPSTDDLGAALRACVDAEVPVRLTGGPGHAVRGTDAAGVSNHGVLNVMGAMRAALNGAEAAEVAEVLASTDVAALASGTRRISEADAAVLRAFWSCWAVPDVTVPLAGLARLGLLPR